MSYSSLVCIQTLVWGLQLQISSRSLCAILKLRYIFRDEFNFRGPKYFPNLGKRERFFLFLNFCVTPLSIGVRLCWIRLKYWDRLGMFDSITRGPYLTSKTCIKLMSERRHLLSLISSLRLWSPTFSAFLLVTESYKCHWSIVPVSCK